MNDTHADLVDAMALTFYKPWTTDFPRGFEAQYKVGINEKTRHITIVRKPEVFSFDNCDNCGTKIYPYEESHTVGRPIWLEDLLSNFITVIPRKTEHICYRCWKREKRTTYD